MVWYNDAQSSFTLQLGIIQVNRPKPIGNLWDLKAVFISVFSYNDKLDQLDIHGSICSMVRNLKILAHIARHTTL